MVIAHISAISTKLYIDTPPSIRTKMEYNRALFTSYREAS